MHNFPFDELIIVDNPSAKVAHLKTCLQNKSIPSCIFVDDLLHGQELKFMSLYKDVYCEIVSSLPLLKIELFDPHFNNWKRIVSKYFPESTTKNVSEWQFDIRIPKLPAYGKELAVDQLQMLGGKPTCTKKSPHLYYSITHNMVKRKYKNIILPNDEMTLKQDFNIDVSGMLPHERLNFFPGLPKRTGSKKQFCKFTNKLESLHVLLCFLIPEQIKEMKYAMKKFPDKKWIFKPDRTTGGGSGISVHDDWEKMPLNLPAIVQEYIKKPFLFNSKKLDMRIYPIITSAYPLRIYLSKGDPGGYARTANTRYTVDLSKRDAHVTNIRGNGTSYRLTFSELDFIINERGLNSTLFHNKLENLISDVVPSIVSGLSDNGKMSHRSGSFHQVLGADVVLDEYANPFIVEINPDPGWRFRTKEMWCNDAERLKQILNLIGFSSKNHYDNLVPATLLQLCREPNIVNEFLLRMIFEYSERGGADLIYPKWVNLEQYKDEDEFVYEIYNLFLKIKPYMDQLMA